MTMMRICVFPRFPLAVCQDRPKLASLRRLLLLLSFGFVACLGFAQEPLRTINEIRELQPAEAEQRLPVVIRGVVTYSDPKDPHGFFVQDDTAGIYVWHSAAWSVKPGQLVEVTGSTGPGDFAPVVEGQNLNDLGLAPLPKPMVATYTDLVGGPADSQFVEIRGVVRTVAPHADGQTQIDIVTEGHRVRSTLPSGQKVNADELIDAEVTLRGVCITHFHDRRWLAAWMRVAASDQIQIHKPATARLFEQELQKAASLLSFNPQGRWLHRVRVRGVVTCVGVNHSIFLQDESTPVEIVPVVPESVAVGDELDVVGFVRGAELHPVLEDAVIRKIGRQSPPTPHTPELENILAGRESGHLIRISGRLVDQMDTLAERLLLIETNERVFQARLPASKALPEPWERGSEVRVTGVCRVPLDSMHHQSFGFEAINFQVHLRSPADVAVLSRPPWWTVERVGVALLIAIAILLAAVGWAATLHSRVNRQTKLIEEKVERHAVLEERNRIARDLHDTLTQSLAGVTFQLEGIRGHMQGASAAVREQFTVAVNMLRHSLAEARRSVLNLRALGLEQSDLLHALEETTRNLVTDASVKLEFQRSGEAESLHPRIEHHLLRLGQEAVANALQHSGCTTIRVTFSQTREASVLEVSDDGHGFDPSGPSRPGHFGLVGMRERANQLSARLDIETHAGHGSIIRVTVPNTSDLPVQSTHA
jgi:signal transduction histidine kinase